MAITAATKTTDFSGFLTPEQSAPIFERASRISVAQRLAAQIPLGANGKAIPVVTGRMQAGWVAEGGQKPASKGTMTLKTMSPQKIASIAVVSAEVVRANPGGYMALIRTQVAEAFALAFDLAAFYDKGPDGTAGAGPYTTFLAQTTKAVEIGTTTQANGGVHGDIVAGLRLLVNDGKRLTGFALDNRLEPTLLSAVDTTGRPIYIDSPLDETTAALFSASQAQPASPGRLIGRPSWMGEGVGEATPGAASTTYTLGFGGDWTQAAWGVVGGISYDVSTEATVTINGALTSLWENNLVAVRAEAEYGWLVNDTAAFVEYTETTPA
jgi:HK97 family phage major capsid protein